MTGSETTEATQSCSDPYSRERDMGGCGMSRPEVPQCDPSAADWHGESGAPPVFCDRCEEVALRVQYSGRAEHCWCGNRFAPVIRREDEADADDAPGPPSWAAPVPLDVDTARGAWPGVLDELGLARRFGAQRAIVAGAPRPPRSTLGALQGRAGGASADASDAAVRIVWQALLRGVDHPDSKKAAETRDLFLAKLRGYLEEASPRGDGGEVDWARARRCAERLRALQGREGALLAALALECAPGTSWREACVRAADIAAPRERRALWSAMEAEDRGMVRRPGRPRVDAARPSAEEARAAWGETELAAAVDAWLRAEGAAR